ncbi:hypothetical protein J4456_00500 [Candidatus Pacearchaeota archaeon]|nr:hypothetical protein [Candidatus Pacearchaeota archaeon]
MKVILDTNFLVYCAKEKIDYMDEIEQLFNEKIDVLVPIQVINELHSITRKKKLRIPLERRSARFKKTTGKDKEAAALAIQMVEKYVFDGKIEKVNTEGKNVDDALLQLAQREKHIVCTLDRELRGKLGRVILINQYKKLMLTK